MSEILTQLHPDKIKLNQSKKVNPPTPEEAKDCKVKKSTNSTQLKAY